ncbi:hypothetical protein WJX75_004154 [Coccomyxa subellipsoidea]|uniref:Endonuclease/exonuclease/phosphatase domain-containing protein n=1 Tax=Coccomyxa subellipsoidea TaxID=248742 RepID=A0ABR2YVW6_9CHLO
MEIPKISLLTWNLWHTGPCEAHRIDAVSKTIAQLDPDVLYLQEVTRVTMEQLSETLWWKCYHRSRDVRKVQEGQEWYFTLLLLKASTFDLESSFLEKLFPNTIMGRYLLASLKFLQTHCSGEVLAAGDMNWIEDDQPAWSLPEGWCDPWEVLMPEDPGYTYDCHRNQMLPWNGYRSRLDRIWCRLQEWKPMHIELVGLSKLKNVRALDNKRVILPSDHFGIYAMFVKRASPGRRKA